MLCVQNKTSIVYRSGDRACFFAGGRGMNYRTVTGNRKELRYSNMMDGNGKMEEEKRETKKTRRKEDVLISFDSYKDSGGLKSRTFGFHQSEWETSYSSMSQYEILVIECLVFVSECLPETL